MISVLIRVNGLSVLINKAVSGITKTICFDVFIYKLLGLYSNHAYLIKNSRPPNGAREPLRIMIFPDTNYATLVKLFCV